MGLKSYLANSLRIAVEVSKASVIKKKLITKYHKFYLHIDSGKDIKKVSKFHQQDHLTEELSVDENVMSEVLLKSDSQIQDEVSKTTKVISIGEPIAEETQKADIELLPPGSNVSRIIIRKGLIVEKVYQTSTGANISIFF